MSDTNVFICSGRLTKAAELKFLSTGSVCNFSLAANYSYKSNGEWVSRPDYFDCAIWGKYGESLAKSLTKGRLITIQGRLKQDRWEKNGIHYSKISVIVSEVNFAPMKKNSDNDTEYVSTEEPMPTEAPAEESIPMEAPTNEQLQSEMAIF